MELIKLELSIVIREDVIKRTKLVICTYADVCTYKFTNVNISK